MTDSGNHENMAQFETTLMPHVLVTVGGSNKSTPRDVSTLIASIEQAIAEGKVEDIPALLGELERLKGILWNRMMTLCSSASNHTPDAITLLTMPQVAKRLAIPEGRAYELARQGRLPTVKVGKYIRISQAKLETWLSQQTSLERRIDREPSDFHSAVAIRKRSVRALTGARIQPGGARREKNDRASLKSPSKKPVGFRPPVATPSSAAESSAVEADASQKEG
jgi:excisionase family DNA binding protein